MDDFPVETTFDDMLTYFLDINQIPSQNLLGLLARFTEDKEDKETLTVLANDEEAYQTWRKDGKVKTIQLMVELTSLNRYFFKDVAETLSEFSSVNIQSSILASQLDIIKPRKYSIASSPEAKEVVGHDLSLVVGVLKYKTETGREKMGLTTGVSFNVLG